MTSLRLLQYFYLMYLGMSDLAWLDTSLMLPYAALQVLAPGLPDKFGARYISILFYIYR